MISYKLDGKNNVHWEYEIENSDEKIIKEQLFELCNQFDYGAEVTIDLCCDITGNTIEFDVIISDYLSKEEYVKNS